LITTAFSRSEGKPGFYGIDLATGTAKRLLPLLEDAVETGLLVRPGRTTVFSPDLSTAYLRGDSSVVAVDLATLEHRILVSFDAPTRGFPTLSGDRLVLWAGLTLWMVNTRTGGKTALYQGLGYDPNLRVASGCGGVNRPLWTGDGRFILVEQSHRIPRDAEFGPSPCRVHKIPADGGDPVLVGALPTHLGWALHPDGTRLALDFGENRSEIWIMEDLPGSR
jgi:hypothetical protein